MSQPGAVLYTSARKHPAPEGALRHTGKSLGVSNLLVRKHPAPEGALRLAFMVVAPWSAARKHLAPEGALRHHSRLSQHGGITPSESTQHQKRLFTGLVVRWLLTALDNGRPTASPLNRPSESPRTTPPPRAPSSSTAIKASTPGGFVPGELARFQETSRSRNASTAGAGQADAHKSGRPRETR